MFKKRSIYLGYLELNKNFEGIVQKRENRKHNKY